MADVLEVTVNNDGTTTKVERDWTPEEKAQRAAIAKAAQDMEEVRVSEREVALAKLTALGLTEVDLEALGL